MSREITLYDRLDREFNAYAMIIYEYQDKVYFLKVQNAIKKENDKKILIMQKLIIKSQKKMLKNLNNLSKKIKT